MIKLFSKIKEVMFKIKDYDRLEDDYSMILDHATCSMLSKTHYNVETVRKVIDEQQKIKYEEDFPENKNLWIDANVDVPCNHPHLISPLFSYTVNVLCTDDIGYPSINHMVYNGKEEKWEWSYKQRINAWMPIPKYKQPESK